MLIFVLHCKKKKPYWNKPICQEFFLIFLFHFFCQKRNISFCPDMRALRTKHSASVPRIYKKYYTQKIYYCKHIIATAQKLKIYIQRVLCCPTHVLFFVYNMMQTHNNQSTCGTYLAFNAHKVLYMYIVLLLYI